MYEMCTFCDFFLTKVIRLNCMNLILYLSPAKLRKAKCYLTLLNYISLILYIYKTFEQANGK